MRVLNTAFLVLEIAAKVALLMRNDSERDAVTLSGLLINTYIVKNIIGGILI